MRMSRQVRLWLALQLVACFLLSIPSAYSQVEAFRARIVLMPGGTVSISIDNGAHLIPIGRVLAMPQRPVTTERTTSGKASLYRPNMWWLQYHESQGIGLAAAGVRSTGALLTDIPGDSVLFRPQHPLLSARLLLQEGRVAYTLPPNYRYRLGDVWVVQAIAPDEATAQAIREAIQRTLPSEAEAAAQRSILRGEDEKLPVVRGVLSLEVTARHAENVQYVFFAIDGNALGTSNILPTVFRWDSTQVNDGEYVVEARAVDKEGRELALVRRKILVRNRS